jgi:hypothetical protein
MDRARFIGEPLVGLLALFFALEALPRDKSEGLKAYGLAFRQTMLKGLSSPAGSATRDITGTDRECAGNTYV